MPEINSKVHVAFVFFSFSILILSTKPRNRRVKIKLFEFEGEIILSVISFLTKKCEPLSLELLRTVFRV